jgi:hypothetical protein
MPYKSTAEAFIVDYPDFHFQSEANNRKFRQPGFGYRVVHGAPGADAFGERLSESSA